APSGHPGPKNGDPLDVLRPEPRRGCPPPPGESDAFGAHRKCAAAIVQRWRTVRLRTALLFPRSDAPIFLARRNLPLGREPGCRREMETDMNIFGSRGGNETPDFALRDGAPAFSEIGAVVAAGVVVRLSLLVLSSAPLWSRHL